MKNVLCVLVSVLVLLGNCFAVGEVDNLDILPEEVQVEEQVETSGDLSESQVSESATGESSDEVETSTNDDGVVINAESPLPVTIIPEDVSFALFDNRSTASSGLVIGNTPPESVPFYGAGYITGTSSSLGTVTLWFPIDYKGTFGVDSNGYLINITSSSRSGYLEGVYNNSVSANGFSYPRYRTSNSYDYTTLYLTPTNSNMDIATDITPFYDFEQVYPYMIVMLLGVVIVCCMKRW